MRESPSTLVFMPAPIRDPYVVLGVAPQASDEQLRAAYRKLVQLNHPDHNPGDQDAARRFEEIQDAYARARLLRASSPQGPPPPAEDAAVEERLATLERELRNAQAIRDQASRAAREASRTTEAPKRATDEELGYISTDDSFGKILADARSELSGWLDGAGEQPVSRRVADLLDELADKLKGEDGSSG